MADDLFYLDVVGNRNLLKNFDYMPTLVQRIVAEKVAASADKVKEEVIANIRSRLGQSKDKQYSGSPEHLADMVDLEVHTEGKGIQAIVSVGGPYARIQEQGGVIPPHVIMPKNGKALAFNSATGDRVIVREVMHPGAVIAGTYYLRDAYRTMSPVVASDVKKAVVEGIREQMHSGGN